MQLDKINLLKNKIEKILSDNKAVDIKSLNLRDKTSIADFMIIASGNSSRHIQALSEILIDNLKENGMYLNIHLRILENSLKKQQNSHLMKQEWNLEKMNLMMMKFAY